MNQKELLDKVTPSSGSWFSKSLGDGMLAYEPLAELEALFLSTYPDAHHAGEIGLFVSHESEGRLHCEVKVYFPPAMAGFAKTVNATACKRPSINGLSLLAGSEMALSHLLSAH